MHIIVSRKLTAAIKLCSEPAYRIAWRADVNPTMLSKLMNGIERPKPNDQRVINVGKILGIAPEDCFEEKIS